MPTCANCFRSSSWCAGGGFSSSIALSVFRGPSGSSSGSIGTSTSRRSAEAIASLPHWLSGVSVYCFWSSWTVATSASPLTSVRPMISTVGVGACARDWSTSAGSSPSKPGPTMANAPAFEPVARWPM